MSKTCGKCKEIKPVSEFHKDKSRTDGLNYSCKTCSSKKGLVRCAEITITSKTCRECKEEKDVSHFSLDKAKADGLRGVCKSCDTIRKANYMETCEPHILENKRAWFKNNRDHIREYEREKRETNAQYSIRKKLSKQLSRVVSFTNSKFTAYLGCSIEYFAKWIEFQFTFDDNLKWENHGEYWHYDHVTPCHAFDLTCEEQAKACFNWSNIRPVRAQVNFKKNGKIIPSLISSHNDIIKRFQSIHGTP